jgi:hypothetical protein
MNGSRNNWCLIILFLIISCLAYHQLVFAKQESLEKQAQNLESVAAPKEFLQSDITVAGSLEIQFFGPDFISKKDHPKIVIKKSSDFDRKGADVELANNPLTYELPVLIKNLTPGEYYIGVRTLPRISVDPVYKIPTPIVEELAWDGSIYEAYIVNAQASAMYIQRWYKVVVNPKTKSLITSLFFKPSGDINSLLSESAKNSSKYVVNLNPEKGKNTFGIDISIIPELLSRTGKVFIPKDFIEDQSSKEFDSVWYLSDTNSGAVKAFGHNKIIEKPKKSFAAANSAIKSAEHFSTDIDLLAPVPLGNNPKSESLFPPVAFEASGKNEIRIKNPNQIKVTIALRSGNSGKTFSVNSKGVASVFVPNGTYAIYFVYSDKPEALFKGDNFTIKDNGIEIQLVKVVGGNYGIRRVN